MEQRDITQRLLSLEQEVMNLKFLNGGAISNLESRVSDIENKGLRFPDFTKLLKIWNLGQNRDALIIPDWSEDNKYSPIYDIPYDGFINVEVHVDNAIEGYTKWVGTGVHILVNSRTVMRASANCSHNHIMFDNSALFPVKKGNTLSFFCNQDPNSMGNYVYVSLYGLL